MEVRKSSYLLLSIDVTWNACTPPSDGFHTSCVKSLYRIQANQHKSVLFVSLIAGILFSIVGFNKVFAFMVEKNEKDNVYVDVPMLLKEEPAKWYA